MDKSKLGSRYTCFKCGCKFYDMNKEDIICPRCQADQAEVLHAEQKLNVKVKPRQSVPKEVELESIDKETEETTDYDTEDLPLDSEDLDGFTIEEDE